MDFSGDLFGELTVDLTSLMTAISSYTSFRYSCFKKHKGVKCIYKVGPDFILDTEPNQYIDGSG